MQSYKRLDAGVTRGYPGNAGSLFSLFPWRWFMGPQEFFIQNAGGNCYVSVNGVPAPGATLWSQPYNGGPAQQWIPAEYPGTDPSDTAGVVCALYCAGTGSQFYLAITASTCGTRVTLEPFENYNLYQLWAYQG